MPIVSAALDVLKERLEQAASYPPSSDDRYVDGEMAAAAMGYVLVSRHFYPWENFGDVVNADRRTRLVRAAALLIAEVERLDRIVSRGAHAS